MRTLFYVLVLSMLTVSANGQWLRVTNLTGSAFYGTPGCGTTVTVIQTGATGGAGTSFCGTDPYWIGIGGPSIGGTPLPGRFTYRFSTPIHRFRITTAHSQSGETIHIDINTAPHWINAGSAMEVFPSGLSTEAFCTYGTWPASYTINGAGDLESTILHPGHASAIIDISQAGITELEISTNGFVNGTVYSLEIEADPSDVVGTIVGPSTACIGDNISFTNTGIAGGTWSSSNTAVANIDPVTGVVTSCGPGIGVAIITYTYVTECGTQTATHAVTVSAIPTATLTAAPAYLCEPGGTSLLSAAISYTGTWPLHYWWDDPTFGMSYPGLTHLASLTSTTTYSFTVTDGICSSIVPITVTVNPSPLVTVAYTGCMPLCPGTPLTYTVHGGPGFVVYYSWSDPCGATGTGSVTLDGSGDGTIWLPGSLCEGWFYLSVTRIIDPETGCTNETGFSIQPIELKWPYADFHVSPAPPLCDKWVMFTIIGTPDAWVDILPSSIPPVHLDPVTGIGTFMGYVSGTTTFTIGTVTAGSGPCVCSHFDGSTYTITPTYAPPPTVTCYSYQDPVTLQWHFGFNNVSGTPGVSVTYTADIMQMTAHLTGTPSYGIPGGPLSLPSGATDVTALDLGYSPLWGPFTTVYPSYYVFGLHLNVIYHDDCHWDSYCSTLISRPGHNDPINTILSNLSNVSVIPNPNIGVFKVTGSLSSVIKSTEATIEITDILGKVIYTYVASIDNGGINKEITLDTDVPNGIYMVRIKNAEVNEVIKFTIDR